MTLPESRNTTYVPSSESVAGSQVKSADLNDIQDQIVVLNARGAFQIKFLPYRIVNSIYSETHVRISTAVVKGLAWSADGKKLYVLVGNTVLQYSAPQPFAASSIVYDSVSLSVASQIQGTATGLDISADGTKLYVGDDYTTSLIREYALTTPNSLAAFAYTGSKTLAEDTAIVDFRWVANGTKLFVVGDTNNSVYQYSATGGAVSTLAHVSTLSVATETTAPKGIDVSVNGNKFWVRGSDNIYQYKCASAFTLAGSSYASVTYAFPTPPVESGVGLRFSGAGTRYALPAEDPTDSLYSSVTEFFCTSVVAMYG